MMRYVIVGAGIAGTTAAEEIRKRDPDGEIVLIGDEQHALYSRVLLPHYVKGKIPRERVFLKTDAWYRQQRIEYLRGERVVSFDARNNHVELESAREIPYDKLLLTTGGEPRCINGDARGVCYLQTLDDADHLCQLLGERETNDRAAVYGGGFIACEFLNIFDAVDVSVTCFHRGPWFWSQVLDQESGRLIHAKLLEHHVEVWPGTTLADMEVKEEKVVAHTTGAPCEVNMLGIGVGLARDLRWIEKGGVKTSAGVVTNRFLETSAPGVFAAGDICEYEDPFTGRQTLSGNWTAALMQGRAVGKTMAGERTEFRLVTSYATKIYDADIIFIGDTRRGLATRVEVTGRAGDGYVVQRFYDGEKLVGATLVGGNRDRKEITDTIGA
ncbi:NAD(P)/FAD-dependent oxidoreductase [Candidatus Uhrbacteria bacterium]|nr:NAD(P)/FAD-dependent oxidoreductase [Candidatus Uhrbacteria bacterium]